MGRSSAKAPISAPEPRRFWSWFRGPWVLLGVAFVLLAAGFLIADFLMLIERRKALAQISSLVTTLESGSPGELVRIVRVPASLGEKTVAEQAQWLRDVLREEIDEDGLAELRSHGQHGPLLELFPDSATAWTVGSGVSPENCLAWRMERSGITAEVVYTNSPEGVRFLRINNVAQMADLASK